MKEFLSSFTNVEMLRLTLDLVPYSEDTNPDIIPVPEYGTIFEKVKSLDLSLTLYSTMKFSGFCVQRFLSSFPNVETLDLMILSKKRYAKASLGSPLSYNTTFPRLVNLFIGLETDTKQDMLIASKSGYIDYCACLAEAGLLGDSALYEILMGLMGYILFFIPVSFWVKLDVVIPWANISLLKKMFFQTHSWRDCSAVAALHQVGVDLSRP